MVKSKKLECQKCKQKGEILRVEQDGTWTERVTEGKWDIGQSGDTVAAYRCQLCGQIQLNTEAKLAQGAPAKKGPAVEGKLKFKVKGKPGPARWPYSIREDKDGETVIYTLYNTRTGEDIGVCSAIEGLLKRNGSEGIRYTTDCPVCDTINVIAAKPGSTTVCTGCGTTIENTGPKETDNGE